MVRVLVGVVPVVVGVVRVGMVRVWVLVCGDRLVLVLAGSSQCGRAASVQAGRVLALVQVLVGTAWNQMGAAGRELARRQVLASVQLLVLVGLVRDSSRHKGRVVVRVGVMAEERRVGGVVRVVRAYLCGQVVEE